MQRISHAQKCRGRTSPLRCVRARCHDTEGYSGAHARVPPSLPRDASKRGTINQRCVRVPCDTTFGGGICLCTQLSMRSLSWASMHTYYGPKIQLEKSALRKLEGMDCAKFKGSAMRRIAHRSSRGAQESAFNDQRCVRTPCKNTFGGARGLCTSYRCAD